MMMMMNDCTRTVVSYNRMLLLFKSRAAEVITAHAAFVAEPTRMRGELQAAVVCLDDAAWMVGMAGDMVVAADSRLRQAAAVPRR